jgi:hypothetical protein
MVTFSVLFVCLVGGTLLTLPIYAQNDVSIPTNINYDDDDSVRVILLGSSFIRAVNSDDIKNYLYNEGVTSKVHHLGVDMDLPSQRIHSINDIISLDPDVVVYGLGYRIGINDGTHEQRYGCVVVKQSDVKYSKALSSKEAINENHSDILVQNDNFENHALNEEQEILAKYTAESMTYEPLSDIKIINSREESGIDTCSELLTKELANLKEILRILKDGHDIDVVLFVTPHPKAYLDRIEDFVEDYDLFLLQSIAYEYGVDVYNISHKYEEEDIFRDFVHVARNSKSKIYSDDISKMILNSLTNRAPDNIIQEYKVTPHNNSLLSQWCENNKNNPYLESKCFENDKKNDASTNVVIPTWIKNNASWWAEGNIDNEAFVSGIQFLIKEGIIQISETTKPVTGSSQEIPSWVKNNADWWSQELISDADFIKGIQFLVENGIITV